MLLDTQPATWRQLQGWTSTLPLGVDIAADTPGVRHRRPRRRVPPRLRRPARTAARRKRQPPAGSCTALNSDSAGIVWWDRWAQHNHNSVVLARSGAGKSYLVKLELLRSLYDGVQVAVIDPEDEYLRLADDVGGTTITLGAPGVRINPLDLPRRGPPTRRPDPPRPVPAHPHRRPPRRTTTAGRAGRAGPGHHRHLHRRRDHQRPHHLDPARTAARATSPATSPPTAATRRTNLAARLDPVDRRLLPEPVRRTHHHPPHRTPRRLVHPPTPRRTPRPRHAPRPGRDLARRRPTDPATGRRATRRLVVVDEAWTLLQDGEGAKFLYRLSKAARKRSAGVAVITQDAADLLGTDLGQAVIANAATQILMRQAPQAIDQITDTFALTSGEARRLLTANRGEALLLSGTFRVGFTAVSSPAEHKISAGAADLDDL